MPLPVNLPGVGTCAATEEFRGTCPACGYPESFVLCTGRTGKVIGWCACCQDRDTIAAILWDGRPAAAPQEAPARDGVRRREAALRLWRSAVPATGTLADTYLTARGLPGLPIRRRCDFAPTARTQWAGGCQRWSRPLPIGWPAGRGATHLFGRRRHRQGRYRAAARNLGPIWGGAARPGCARTGYR